jgi:phage-related tail protein
MGELGGMASQLKQSSLSLHDSLKQSNNTVDGLGEAAEANAAKVAAEAERVAKTSRKRMKATCASMGAIGAILATFVLTYLFAIKLFPKRAVFEARRVEGGGGEL